MKISTDYIEFRKLSEISLITLYNLPIENMPWVKRPSLSEQPIVFYNKCKMYFDNSSLPPYCVDVTDVSNKNVLYGIFCNNKFYVGSTTDFGERMATHIKNTRKDKSLQQLYSDMIKNGEAVSFIFAIFEDEKMLKDAEHMLIKECKKYSIKKACNFDEKAEKFINESIEDTKEYAQKYCYNIID